MPQTEPFTDLLMDDVGALQKQHLKNIFQKTESIGGKMDVVNPVTFAIFLRLMESPRGLGGQVKKLVTLMQQRKKSMHYLENKMHLIHQNPNHYWKGLFIYQQSQEILY